MKLKKIYTKPNVMVERFEMDLNIALSEESEQYQLLKDTYDKNFAGTGVTWEQFLEMSNVNEKWCYMTAEIPS